MKDVVAHYLDSHDFNGIGLKPLLDKWTGGSVDLIKQLIVQEELQIVSHDWDNPYIKRLDGPSIKIGLDKLESGEMSGICVYPTRKHMRKVIPRSRYRTRPFTKMLALGYAQLHPVFFDLSVLQRYQSDPRYVFSFRGLDGSISTDYEHYRSRKMSDADKVVLQTFGLGLTRNRGRVAAVFLRYLSRMPARHQQHWESHRVRKLCKVESNYYRRGAFGEWTKGMSVYEALLEEMSHINKMCALIGLPVLFKKDFSDDPPQGFGLLVQTTYKQYLAFADLMDKIISENLNPEFFERQGIALKQEGSDAPKGTLHLFEEWLRRVIRFQVQDGPKTILRPLKRVRSERSRLAHSLVVDDYSETHQANKVKLINDVYTSISNIRLFFQSHPKCQGYEFPDALDPQNIVLY